MHAMITSPQAPGRLVEADLPAPRAGAGIAVVRVRASSINRGETRLIPARPNGWAPGQDLAGIVERAAIDGGPAEGTRVVGLADGGSWSELVPVPVERLAVLPDAVSDEVAATLGVAGLTALRAVRALGSIIGRQVLVTGVRGATGNVAAQLLRIAGAHVTGLARNTFAFEGVRIVTALTDADRFDGVVDAAGGEVLAGALSHLTPHAKAVTFAGGTPAPIGLGSFAGVQATLEALFVYGSPGRFDDDLATLVRFVADGLLAPHIDRALPIIDVNAGLAALEAGGIDGKIVLVRA
jgi:NADPH:quinone reductase